MKHTIKIHWLLLLVATLIASAGVAQAHCVYNDTDRPVEVWVRPGNFHVTIPPGGNACNHWSNYAARDAMLTAEVQTSDFNSVLGLQAGGYLKVQNHREENGVKATLVCHSWNFNNQLIDQKPYVSTPGNRDVRFIATGDPQYENNPGETTERTNKRTRTDALMARMVNQVRNSGYYRGIIIAGDLTQNTRQDEFSDYKAAISGFSRFVYDGLGNHDVEVGSCCNGTYLKGLPCTCPALVADDIATRKRSTPRASAKGPYYSWDWHDVHFVQLNLYPGDKPDGFGSLVPIDSLNFLKEDLRTQVGNSGRPVVLIHHYGADSFSTGADGEAAWWSEAERLAYWNAIADYNVVALITGHLHSVKNDESFWYKQWERPSGTLRGKNFIPDFVAGGACDGYYTEFQITNNRLIARRIKTANDGRTFQEISTKEFATTDEGLHQIINQNSKKALTVVADGTYAGARIVQWQNVGADSQLWSFSRTWDGYYIITAKHSGLSLTVAHASQDNSAAIVQAPNVAGTNQKFRLEPTGSGGYTVFALHSNKVLDVENVSQADGAAIQQYAWWGVNHSYSAAQKFEINAIQAGRLLRDPASGGVYFVSGNTRKGIPDPQTFNNLGFNWGDVQDNRNVRLYPNAPPYPSLQHRLVASNGRVFVLEKGLRRWIPDPQTFEAMGFSWGNWTELDGNQLAAIPEGAPLPRRYGRLVRNAAGTVYFVHQGQRKGIPDLDTFNNLGLAWNDIVQDETLLALPESAAYPSISKLLVRDSSTGGIYLLERGVRRWIPDPHTYSLMGFEAGNWQDLNAQQIDAIPEGPSLLRL